MERKLINQEDNFSGHFGEVLRASSIFWVKNTDKFKTTINFLNYWKIKRDLKVAIICTLRTLSGDIVKRFRLDQAKANVTNLNEFPLNFEGSLELEVFSTENMIIPYSAMMAVYESQNGISMVHSYTRTYSLHEAEEGRTICDGEEGDWQINDNKEIRSFCVIHNGFKELKNQVWILKVTNANGEVRTKEIKISNIKQYETLKIYPDEHIEDLHVFLGKDGGNAALSFQLGQSFTRMLLCHEKNDFKDFQVTHSNFNYSKHQTNILDKLQAYMFVPKIKDVKTSVLVYPDAEPGIYKIQGNKSYEFISGAPLLINNEENSWLEFDRRDGKLPSRIVTAIKGNIEGSSCLPFECSLGVMTKKRPLKRMWWGMCSLSDSYQSQIIALPMDRIYGDLPADIKIFIKLYNSLNTKEVERELEGEQATALKNGINFKEIFPNIDSCFKSNYCYFTLYSDYGGFWVYSTLRNKNNSFTIEHAF